MVWYVSHLVVERGPVDVAGEGEDGGDEGLQVVRQLGALVQLEAGLHPQLHLGKTVSWD